MGNKADRAEEACEFYKQAATNYKLSKRCDYFRKLIIIINV